VTNRHRIRGGFGHPGQSHPDPL